MTAWKKGDHALCLQKEPWTTNLGTPVNGPAHMSLNVVAGVQPTLVGMGLYIENFPTPIPFAAVCFRKLEPHIPDEDDELFLNPKVPADVDV